MIYINSRYVYDVPISHIVQEQYKFAHIYHNLMWSWKTSYELKKMKIFSEFLTLCHICIQITDGLSYFVLSHIKIDACISYLLGPLLLTWFNLNPSMDK